MNASVPKSSLARLIIAVALVFTVAPALMAQRGRGAGPAPAQSPRASAPIDLTGYWVSIVNEDWRWRMVTALKGDVSSVPLNQEGRKIAESWEPATDGSCLAYGAAGLMRMPTRLNIIWESENTLRIDTDAGTQTRRLFFDKVTQPPAAKSLQGFSLAEWERFGAGRGGPGGAGPVGGGAPAAPTDAARGARPGGPGGPVGGGSLKVVTTHLSAAWLRRNGVPYSDRTTMIEYLDRFATPGGEQWLVITTAITDPTYLNQEFVTSTHFRREPDGSKWAPSVCRA